MRNVTKIPATINRLTAQPIDEVSKRKVAAYARVSTDQEEQLTSYAAQLSYYEEYIKGHNDWEFVDVYADEGISGCSTRKRDGFNRMIADALAGKIQLIVTKSVSRFARNTVDSLTTIRKLKEHNVECYFEKEGLWTFDSKSETILAIMSSLAQEESRSISENVTWGQRKRMADGKFSMPYSTFLGYDKGENGELVINPEEAKTVRLIYKLYLEGMTTHTIAMKLTEMGIKTPAKKDKWSQSTVLSILSNEKYKGDALLQKTYTTDFLTKKKKKNAGEVPQFYVSGSHEAIIEPHIFDMVQAEMKRRKRNGKNRYSGVSIFSSKIKCGCCGSWFGSKVWHSNDKYRKVIYQCNSKYQNKCSTPHIDEETIKQAFVSAVNKMLSCKDSVIADAESMMSELFDTTLLENQQSELQDETQMIAEMVDQCVAENAHVALDQKEYKKRYNGLVEKFNIARKCLDDVTDEICHIESQRSVMASFLSSFKNMPNSLDEFSEETWCTLVELATVYSTDDIRFTFKNGQEIKA